MFNNDFSPKREISLGKKPNSTMATCLTLNAFDLVDALEKNELKGELKEIAQELNEESNPIIMLVKYRN